MTTRELQKIIFANKSVKGFNTTDVYEEFCQSYVELGEAARAYLGRDVTHVGEELADTMIYLFGIGEILGVDIGNEILKKLSVFANRVYLDIDGLVWKFPSISNAYDAYIQWKSEGNLNPVEYGATQATTGTGKVYEIKDFLEYLKKLREAGLGYLVDGDNSEIKIAKTLEL